MATEDGYLKKEDILFLTFSNWNKELVSNRYHYATRFAKRNRVLFVEVVNEPHRTFYKKLKKLILLPKIREVEKNLFVISLINPGIGSEARPILNKCIKCIYKYQLFYVLKKLRVCQPICWTYRYDIPEILSEISQKFFIFHYTEDYFGIYHLFNSPKDKDIFKKIDVQINQTMMLCDLILSVSPGLTKRVIEGYPFIKDKIFTVRNGVDINLYNFNNVHQVEEIKSFKKPIVGYQGGISPKVNFKLLTKCAKQFPNASFIFIGPVLRVKNNLTFQSFSKLPNVYLLGRKEVRDLPSYINEFDICLIPFIEEKWFSEVALPLKLGEYLSLGKPVVSTFLENVEEDLVYMSHRDDNEFINNLENALKEKKKTDYRNRFGERTKYADSQSYDKKFIEANHIIIKQLEETKSKDGE